MVEPMKRRTESLFSTVQVQINEVESENVISAYPNNPAARKAMRAQAKCRNPI